MALKLFDENKYCNNTYINGEKASKDDVICLMKHISAGKNSIARIFVDIENDLNIETAF